jgi:hypothetical protein
MDDLLQRLSDEHEVRRLAIRMSNGMDARDYDLFRSSWADEVELDVPPLAGDAVPLSGKLKADDYARGVIALLSHYKATQHVSTNHDVEVDGDEATCVCYTLATHFLPVENGDPWLTAGARYDFTARRFRPAGWKIVKFKVTQLWASGNYNLWREVTRSLRKAANS